jgi:cation transporter-like permease
MDGLDQIMRRSGIISTLSLFTLLGIVSLVFAAMALNVAWKPSLRMFFPLIPQSTNNRAAITSAALSSILGIGLIYEGHSDPAFSRSDFTVLGVGLLAAAALNLVAAWKPGLSLDALRRSVDMPAIGWSRRTSLIAGISFLVVGIVCLILGSI